jgi:predicted ester cyclase
MEQHRKNKEFIINYYNALSGVAKTRELMEKYIADEALISHGEIFEAAFPNYEVVADEITAEGNRVIVKARTKGTHLGEFGGIPATYKTVDFPFVICYEIENNMIISHWMLADKISLMEQLGVIPEASAAH